MFARLRLLLPAWLGMLFLSCAWSQDRDLQTLDAIAKDFESRVRVRGIPETAFMPPAKIRIETIPPFSFYEKGTVTEARFSELPPPVQANINHWASFTSDQPSGDALFRDMFYRFFFVHELGHWVQARVLKARRLLGEQISDTDADFYYQGEIEANRISIAWWREHDPAYLARLVADFRAIESRLPSPVPAGREKVQYFIENYTKLQDDPDAYGWYQLDLVVTAYDQPSESFQHVLDQLPAVKYKAQR